MDFKIWSESVESEQTLEVGRDCIRDVYTLPNGMKVYTDLVMPRNPFAKQRFWVTLDYTVLEKDPATLAAGGTVEQWYEEEGFGHPQFDGDEALEKCYEFAMALKPPTLVEA